MSQLALRGHRLTLAVLLLVVAPAFLTYGYNQTVLGGVLTPERFVGQSPEMDTLNTVGTQRTYNSNIQGKSMSFWISEKS